MESGVQIERVSRQSSIPEVIATSRSEDPDCSHGVAFRGAHSISVRLSDDADEAYPMPDGRRRAALQEACLTSRTLAGAYTGAGVASTATMSGRVSGRAPACRVKDRRGRRLDEPPLQPLVDERGESIEPRTPHRRRASIPRRDRELQRLLHALARDPEVARRLTRAHRVPARQADLAIQLHGVPPPPFP